MDLSTMTIDELHQLLDAIQTEITQRTHPESVPVMQLWTHPCKDSSNHHQKKYKHWAKALSRVDTSQTNGYAWEGKFLSVPSQHLVPQDSLVVAVCDADISVYQITDHGPITLGEAPVRSQHALITAIAERFPQG